MTRSAYKITGIRYEVTRSFTTKLVTTEVFRDTWSEACQARQSMKVLGYRATIRPTAGMWTQELELS